MPHHKEAGCLETQVCLLAWFSLDSGAPESERPLLKQRRRLVQT